MKRHEKILPCHGPIAVADVMGPAPNFWARNEALNFSPENNWHRKVFSARETRWPANFPDYQGFWTAAYKMSSLFIGNGLYLETTLTKLNYGSKWLKPTVLQYRMLKAEPLVIWANVFYRTSQSMGNTPCFGFRPCSQWNYLLSGAKKIKLSMI